MLATRSALVLLELNFMFAGEGLFFGKGVEDVDGVLRGYLILHLFFNGRSGCGRYLFKVGLVALKIRVVHCICTVHAIEVGLPLGSHHFVLVQGLFCLLS